MVQADKKYRPGRTHGMHIDAAALSHIGKKKDKNEDSFGIFDRRAGLRLFQQGC